MDLTPKTDDPIEAEIISLIQEHINSSSPNTLLLHDPSPGERSLSALQQNAQFTLLDALQTLHNEYYVKQRLPAQLCEKARFYLTYAMLRGRVLVVRLGHAAVDFVGLFNDDHCPARTVRSLFSASHAQHSLPSGFMLSSGENIKNHPPLFPDSLLRKEDWDEIKEDPRLSPCSEKFRVIITTTIPPERMEELLFNGAHGLPGGMDCYDIKSLSKYNSAAK